MVLIPFAVLCTLAHFFTELPYNRLEGLANFINVLREAFMHGDPKFTKKESQVINVFLRFWDLYVSQSCA